MDSDYQNRLKEVKKFFKDFEASLNGYNQTLSVEENTLIAIDIDQDKVDTLLRAFAKKEECVTAAEKFISDQLFQMNTLLVDLEKERLFAVERLQKARLQAELKEQRLSMETFKKTGTAIRTWQHRDKEFWKSNVTKREIIDCG